MLFRGQCGRFWLALGLLGVLPSLPVRADSPSTVAAHVQIPALGFSFSSLFETRATITFESFPVEPVMARAQQVVQNLQGQVSNPIFVVHVHRKEITPTAAVTSAAGMCIVVLNKNPEGWAVWDRFFESQTAEQRMNMVELAVAHEIGHCVQHQDLQSQGLFGSENELEVQSVPATIDSELFADVYAGVYAQRHMGEPGVSALKTLMDVRQRFSWLEPTHDTASPLKALMPEFSQTSMSFAPRPLSLKALDLLSELPKK
ncbi:MAG: neutral zinc metallopeptidase [Burkholderiales bacterium]|nr:neutral zinc metallopeptidase [Burkholderiales bacterium]